ncbi:hypothetical protein [Nitrosomonas communis]|uniref:hypothetical protein n=1 Tax=Nitrosomonas communis TaxID=44574 RepID=UPI0009422D2F|nr:hypothetical protein [Nitrosomonas communis]
MATGRTARHREHENKLLPLFDILSLRKHALIVTVNDQLKAISRCKWSILTILAHLASLLI